VWVVFVYHHGVEGKSPSTYANSDRETLREMDRGEERHAAGQDPSVVTSSSHSSQGSQLLTARVSQSNPQLGRLQLRVVVEPYSVTRPQQQQRGSPIAPPLRLCRNSALPQETSKNTVQAAHSISKRPFWPRFLLHSPFSSTCASGSLRSGE
jgi:hypothetical protein